MKCENFKLVEKIHIIFLIFVLQNYMFKYLMFDYFIKNLCIHYFALYYHTTVFVYTYTMLIIRVMNSTLSRLLIIYIEFCEFLNGTALIINSFIILFKRLVKLISI